MPPAARSGQQDTGQREWHFQSPAAIALVDQPALNRWADNAWLRQFLDHFDDVADSLERAGYAAAVTFRDTVVVSFAATLIVPDSANPAARDTLVSEDGATTPQLASSGLPITYFFVAPGRKVYRQSGGETAHRLLAQWHAWVSRGPAWARAPGFTRASVTRTPSAAATLER